LACSGDGMKLDATIGVLGARSFVGAEVLRRLGNDNVVVYAYSRSPMESDTASVRWILWDGCCTGEVASNIPLWVSALPIWTLPAFFPLLERCGIKRLVALSSTSRFTKISSADASERALAENLAQAESCLTDWAEARDVKWFILRPTLIYGSGRDKNISEIARVIRRTGFFPILGAGKGLRQPIRSTDVAEALIRALNVEGLDSQALNITGGETLGYKEIVRRVFVAYGMHPRFLTVPVWFFKLAIVCARISPKYRNLKPEMALRMNQDLVFDGSPAERMLGFKAAGLCLRAEDLP